EGSFIVDAREELIARPADADRLGLGMVYQHFTLVPSMTAAENLVMARADVPRIIDWKAERARPGTFQRKCRSAWRSPSRSARYPGASAKRPKPASSFISTAAFSCSTSRPRR